MSMEVLNVAPIVIDDEKRPRRLTGFKHPFRVFKALGNRLRHEYDGLRVERLWEIVTRDLPSLEADCRGALERLQDRESP